MQPHVIQLDLSKVIKQNIIWTVNSKYPAGKS